MPPKKAFGTRRQRTDVDEEFSDLPIVSLARFASPQTHTITLPIELPASQLGGQATYNTVAAKLLFQPAKNFGISVDGEVEKGPVAAATAPSNTKNKKKQNDEEDDEQNVDDLISNLHSAPKNSHIGVIGRKSTVAPKLLPRRIICGIVQVSDVRTVQTKTSVRGGDLFKLNVDVTVQTVRVLSDGFCSAMVCRSQQQQQQQKSSSSSEDASSIEKSDSFGVKLSLFISKEFNSNDKGAKKNSKKEEDNDDEEETSEKNEFFTATLPLDAPHVLAAAAAENKFGGKKVLVTIENNGTSWRAHLGVTPGNGSGGKFQSGGHWEVHMPWSRSEKKVAWNFRAPPPSQRSNEDRVVIKFVKDPIKPQDK